MGNPDKHLPLFLLADDNSTKRAFLRRFVERQLQVHILEATTTEQAIALIREHVEIGAAFIDYAIPTQNGSAIVRELLRRNPHACVAVVSAGNSAEQRARAKIAGAQHYICTSDELPIVERSITELLAQWQVELQQEFAPVPA